MALLTVQSIFVPYFGYLLDDSLDLLHQYSYQNVPDSREEMREQHAVISAVLSALAKCFLYDTEEFINQERFEKLLQPLVDQLENVQDGSLAALEDYESRMKEGLIPCLAQLAVCVGNDVRFIVHCVNRF